MLLPFFSNANVQYSDIMCPESHQHSPVIVFYLFHGRAVTDKGTKLVPVHCKMNGVHL
jgi:hypothetical protein